MATTVPPSWSADFPASWSMTAGDSNSFAVADYLSGDPAPTVTLTTDAPSGDYRFENGAFSYHPTSTGTYTFVFTASNVLGTADATLSVTVIGGDTPTTLFEEWLSKHGSSGHAADETAANGHTYWDNYIADIDPTNDFLEVTFVSTADGTLSIVPLSANRDYQLLYYTNIMSAPVTNDLDPANPVFPLDATGFGRIRVTLPP